jgi:aerobic carbon-monoxide dehydrogenase large subunit
MTEKSYRREDERLLTGKGCYTADWNLPRQLYAYFLRADRAHAKILGIDAQAARARAGVQLVLTAADLDAAGFKSLPGGVAFEGAGGQKMKKPFWPALARERVHYVGQPVALVVAESVLAAQDAAEEISLDYEDLPAAVGFDDATRTGATQIHAEAPGNLAFEYESGDAAAVAAAFARAAFTSRMTMNSQRLVGSPIEPRAFVADCDAENGVVTAYAPSQGINAMRAQLSQVTRVPAEKLRVVTRDVGGSFGVRGGAYPESIALVLAAQKLGRPVKWVALRSELFLSENHGRALSLTGELALDADGRFLAIRFDDRADLGAYATMFGALIGTRNLAITMGGVYRIPALYARARLAYSNATPVSSYRGAGRPDIACAIERLVDHAAAEHGFDPVELRRRNFVPPEAMPYKTANGTTYDCGEFAAVMDKALALADWAGFPARREQSARAGKLRGIGMATFLEASGAGSAPRDEVFARFDSAGELHLYAVSQSGGQGHETTFVNIVTSELGISGERVHFHEGDPDLTQVGNGTGGSRSLYGAGSAFKLLGPKIIETAVPHAAAALGAELPTVQYADGAFHAAGRSIGLFELSRRLAATAGIAQAAARRAAHPMDCTADCLYGVTFPNGCHIAEVEIDADTGTVDILAYTTVDDVGNAIDRASVEGQVHGGVMQGVGQVLGEHAIHDHGTGQLLTGSFMDYPMPRADWMRGIRCAEHPVPTKANALGAKGVGESGTSGALPATMNAVLAALRPAGVRELDMPATPDRVWRALRAARPVAAARGGGK